MLNQIVQIKEDDNGKIDLDNLEKQLQLYTAEKYSKNMKIGTFSAASNITGILSDVDAITVLMHKYGGLVFFDYAAAASHIKIDMNPLLNNIE